MLYTALVTGLRSLGYLEEMTPEQKQRERDRRAEQTARFIIALAHDVQAIRRRP